METIIERFWSKVDIRGEDECWEWKAGTFSNGYGQFYDGNTTVLAHRFSYKISKGEIPELLIVRHEVCDNPPCVNPNHLFLGTHKENTQDMYSKGRDKPPSREEHGRAKLTQEDVELIRYLYKHRIRFDIDQYSLSSMFGVSQSNICRIINNQLWL